MIQLKDMFNAKGIKVIPGDEGEMLNFLRTMDRERGNVRLGENQDKSG